MAFEHYILEGTELKPVSFGQWLQVSAKVIAKTDLGPNPDQSVVTFCNGVGPHPLHTTIYGGEHSGLQWNYNTYQDAMASHARIVSDLLDEKLPVPMSDEPHNWKEEGF